MILSINDVSKSYGSEIIISGINLKAQANSHIGLIGINGSGKTTLLKIISSEIDPDSGSVYIKDRSSVGYLTQDLNLDESKTIYEETLGAFSKLLMEEEALELLRQKMEKVESMEIIDSLGREYHRRLEAFEANRGFYFRSFTKSTLKGLNFSDEELDIPVSHLSGGQKMRVALAKMLIAGADLILLDEPTNYLDISSIAWLEGFLSSYDKAFIVVSHDRYFLDKVTNTIWEAENTNITSYGGSYSDYVKNKEHLRISQMKAYEKAENEINRQKEVIAKLKSYNREKTVRRAESREKLLEKIKLPEKVADNRVSNFRFEAAGIITKRALMLENLSIGYGEKVLVSGIDIEIKTGQKIGISGDNASGKSTLFRTIDGQILPLKGQVILGSGVKVAYFKQEHEDLNPENTIIDELAQFSGEDNLVIRNLLGSLLFSNDDVYKKIEVLSGGERSRVVAAKLMLTKSNLLLLDEPTNHLDFETKEMFERVIKNFVGTVIVISHDRYLLNTVADRMIFFENSHCFVYDEPYEKASEKHSLYSLKPETKKKQDDKKTVSQSDSNANESLSKNRRRQIEKRIIDIENEIVRLKKDCILLEEEFNTIDFYKDQNYANSKTSLHEQYLNLISNLEDEWVECVELIENDN